MAAMAAAGQPEYAHASSPCEGDLAGRSLPDHLVGSISISRTGKASGLVWPGPSWPHSPARASPAASRTPPRCDPRGPECRCRSFGHAHVQLPSRHDELESLRHTVRPVPGCFHQARLLTLPLPRDDGTLPGGQILDRLGYQSSLSIRAARMRHLLSLYRCLGVGQQDVNGMATGHIVRFVNCSLTLSSLGYRGQPHWRVRSS